MNNLEAMVIKVLTSYNEGAAVDTTDPLTKRVVDKLWRRGLLVKAVSNGEMSVSDYGRRVLRKFKAMEGEVAQ